MMFRAVSTQQQLSADLNQEFFPATHWSNRPFGRAVMYSSMKQEIRGSNFGPVKLDAVSPRAGHLRDISSEEAVLPGLNNAEMGPVNSLHA